MGFGDKFKDLTQQAKEKVAENREKIHEVVDSASVIANEKTQGKYASKIMKVNQKAGAALERFGSAAGAGTGEAEGDAPASAAEPDEGSVTASGGPSFADEQAPAPPAGGWAATGEGPKFDDEA